MRETKLNPDALPDLYRALTHALGVIVEFGDLNGFRNMSDAELGKMVTAVAVQAAEALTKADGSALSRSQLMGGADDAS